MNDKALVEADWQKAVAKVNLLQRELDITNADHIALWIEANTIPDEPMSQCISWLACRIIEAHEIEMAKARLALQSRIEVLEAALNKPEIHDWAKGVAFEAAHQRQRWGAEHDAGKSPFDWFWLIGYLAQKAADAAVRGDTEKAMHHTISTSAALANWHLALTGGNNSMRPGIEPPALAGDTNHG